MKDLYKSDCYCMDFSNEEIEKYLLAELNKYPQIFFKILTDEFETNRLGRKTGKIDSIYLDGAIGKFNIAFYGHQTSIYISDVTLTPSFQFTFNEEFMFIDDLAKEHIVSSDTHGNIVYEGTLRDKSHKEILHIFCRFIVLLIGTNSITVEETAVSQTGWQYPKCNYVVNLSNALAVKEKVQIENILFKIN